MDSEQMLRAAHIMQDAATAMTRAADLILEAVRRLEVQVDPSFGGTLPRLLDALEAKQEKQEASDD